MFFYPCISKKNRIKIRLPRFSAIIGSLAGGHVISRQLRGEGQFRNDYEDAAILLRSSGRHHYGVRLSPSIRPSLHSGISARNLPRFFFFDYDFLSFFFYFLFLWSKRVTRTNRNRSRNIISFAFS